MVQKAGGALLGRVVLAPGDQDPELPISLIQAAEGHGLALESTRALRDYAFRVLECPGLVSYVSPGKTRSITLMERLGAQPEPLLDVDGALVYRHTPL